MSLDISIAWKTAAKILNEMLSLLPNFIIGMAIFILFLVVASLTKSLTRRVMLRRLPRQGLAFQNILQNFLAGILLLLQEPFRLGDFISVTGIEGNVSDIPARRA